MPSRSLSLASLMFFTVVLACTLLVGTLRGEEVITSQVRASSHALEVSTPVKCADRSLCRYYTAHKQHAPGTYYNYVFHDAGRAAGPPLFPPSLFPVPVLGVIAMTPTWVGRMIDSIDHRVSRLVVVQNGKSEETSAAIRNATQRYKRRFKGALVTYIYWPENEGCAAGEKLPFLSLAFFLFFLEGHCIFRSTSLSLRFQCRVAVCDAGPPPPPRL